MENAAVGENFVRNMTRFCSSRYLVKSVLVIRARAAALLRRRLHGVYKPLHPHTNLLLKLYRGVNDPKKWRLTSESNQTQSFLVSHRHQHWGSCHLRNGCVPNRCLLDSLVDGVVRRIQLIATYENLESSLANQSEASWPPCYYTHRISTIISLTRKVHKTGRYLCV